MSEIRQWRDFVTKHFELIGELGLPSSIVESEVHWNDFLHHGRLEITDDWTEYQYPPPGAPSHETLFHLIEVYFDLRGPCVSLCPGLISSEEERIFSQRFADAAQA